MAITPTPDQLFSYLINEKGQGRSIPIQDLPILKPSPNEFVWTHFNHTLPEVRALFKTNKIVDPIIQEILFATTTRPRIWLMDHGLLIVIRGLYHEPIANIDQTVSIRIWIQENHVFSCSRVSLPAIKEIEALINKDISPRTISDLLYEMINRLTLSLNEPLDRIRDNLDVLENTVITKHSRQLRPKLLSLHQQVISLKRYLSPQREVVQRLQAEKIDWLNETTRRRLVEIQDRTIHQIEELDNIRDRTSMIQEELNARISEQIESRIYLLSVVSVIFLPLNFLTSLLGTNLSGIPGASSAFAFPFFSILLILVVIIEFWIFKKKRWI